MLALLALIAFVVAIVEYGSVHGYVFWMLLGFILFSAAYVFDAFGYGDRFLNRRQ